MRLSIIIVNYNGRFDLVACLRSLAANPPRISHEIVVVDNASTDGSADAVRQHCPGVRVLEAGANLGFAPANNLGIRATTGESILLLNPDTIVRPGALDALLTALDEHPEAAAAGPRLVDAAGRAELSFGRMLAPLNEVRQKTIVALQALGFRPACRAVERMTRQPRRPDWVSGACLLVRRADAEAVGLLDERYFMYAEDVDFCAALRASGRAILFVPDAEIVHLRGRSRAQAPGPTTAAYRRSQLAFYAKHHPRWLLWLRLYLKVRGKLPPEPSASPETPSAAAR